MFSKTKGVVLISILLIVLLLSSIAVLFGNKYFLSLKRAEYIEFQTISINIFRNMEAIVEKAIEKELQFNSNKLSKDNPILNNEYTLNINEAEVISLLRDASNCFNINSLVKESDNNFVENNKSIDAFRRFMKLMDVDNNIIEELIDQVIDWIDKDTNPRAYGLEDYYYSGPLHNPREYTGMRLIIAIEELKGIPAAKNIDWEIFNRYFCALPSTKGIKFNINTLTEDDKYLITSIFPNIDILDAEYIIDNIPQEGFDSFNSFQLAFPDLNFGNPNGELIYTSNFFEINTIIKYKEFSSNSISQVIYGGNKNSYIISRTYNGI